MRPRKKAFALPYNSYSNVGLAGNDYHSEKGKTTASARKQEASTPSSLPNPFHLEGDPTRFRKVHMDYQTEVKRIADLCRLRLEDSEIETVTQNFKEIVDYIALLNECNVADVEPTSHVTLHVTGERTPLRQDTLDLSRPNSLPVEDVLGNAPARLDDTFQVPAIIAAD